MFQCWQTQLNYCVHDKVSGVPVPYCLQLLHFTIFALWYSLSTIPSACVYIYCCPELRSYVNFQKKLPIMVTVPKKNIQMNTFSLKCGQRTSHNNMLKLKYQFLSNLEHFSRIIWIQHQTEKEKKHRHKITILKMTFWRTGMGHLLLFLLFLDYIGYESALMHFGEGKGKEKNNNRKMNISTVRITDGGLLNPIKCTNTFPFLVFMNPRRNPKQLMLLIWRWIELFQNSDWDADILTTILLYAMPKMLEMLNARCSLLCVKRIAYNQSLSCS